MKINDGSYGIWPHVTPDTDAGADTMRDIASESYEVMHYSTRIIICTIIFQFISFHHNCFQKVSILDCFPLPSLLCYHCFASLSDEQEASKSHCLLWVLYFLHRLLIFEYIAYGTVHFIALRCNEVNCLSMSQNEFCRGWMSYAMIDILNESIL